VIESRPEVTIFLCSTCGTGQSLAAENEVIPRDLVFQLELWVVFRGLVASESSCGDAAKNARAVLVFRKSTLLPEAWPAKASLAIENLLPDCIESSSGFDSFPTLDCVVIGRSDGQNLSRDPS